MRPLGRPARERREARAALDRGGDAELGVEQHVQEWTVAEGGEHSRYQAGSA